MIWKFSLLLSNQHADVDKREEREERRREKKRERAALTFWIRTESERGSSSWA